MTDKGEKAPLAKPKFVKVTDLEHGRSGYNVFVKVVEAKERTLEIKDGQKIAMIDALVADETGSVRAFFKGDNTNGIKVGATIAIRNGVKRIIKGRILLELNLFGRVTPENVSIKPNTQKNISDLEIKF
jgi:ssDNA-binding replication factor A large subunit